MIDLLALEHQLRDINQELKRLRARRNSIRQTLAKHGAYTRVAADYFSKDIWVYCLELEHGKFYVGMSRNVEKRFRRHARGKGAAWTRLHKPVRIVTQFNTHLTDEREAAILEDDMTVDMARLYGFDNVRGGKWCTIGNRWPDHIVEPDNWIKIAQE